MSKKHEPDNFEQMSIFGIMNLLDNTENTLSSDDISKIIDKLSDAKRKKESIEAKKRRQEERERREREAREAKERKEEAEQQAEAISEAKDSQEEVLDGVGKADSIELESNIKKKSVDHVEEAQKQINKILKDNNLVNDDLKGIEIDLNF